MVILRVLLAIGLSSVFLTSALPKMRNPKNFQLAVIEYRMLPFLFSRLLALILPALELLIALLLLTGTFVRLAALSYAILILSFLIAISVNLRRGRDLRCHCFGTKSKRKISAKLVVQDVLLFVSALLLAALTPSWWGSEQWSIMPHDGLVPFAVFLLLGVFSVILSLVLGSTKVISNIAKFIPLLKTFALTKTSASQRGGLR